MDLPKAQVDTSIPPEGKIINVQAGQKIQAAIDQAQPGDTIVLPAGATFTEEVLLKDKGASTKWITIRSSELSQLPEGQRVSPADAKHMAKIVAPKGNGTIPAISSYRAIRALDKAHHYRFMGIELTVDPGSDDYGGIVELGSVVDYSQNPPAVKPVSLRPHHIVFDRVYVHGLPKPSPTTGTYGTKRGFAFNGSHYALINSHVSDIKRVGQDAQAVGGFSGTGPYKIVNNFLEASGENILFGGMVTPDASHTAADIEVCNNHFYKPPAWKFQEGDVWCVKNLFELKHGTRVVVTGNVFEGNWSKCQSGYAILIKSSAQGADPTQTFQKTEDLLFAYNIITETAHAFNISGGGSNAVKTGPTSDVYVAHNIFDKLGPDSQYGGQGRGFQVGKAPVNLVIEHNTMLNHYTYLSINPDAAWGPIVNFQFLNNIVGYGTPGYGIHGTSGSNDEAQFAAGSDAASKMAGNVIALGPGKQYPSNNNTAVSGDFKSLGFSDFSSQNYKLGASSPHAKAGVGGVTPGADYDAVMKVTAGVK